MAEKLAGIHIGAFDWHDLDSDAQAIVNKWREYCKQTQSDVAADLPDSAELTIAMRHLEQFAMYLNKAIALHGVK